MKKSKIVGLSLGFTALAAVAISTPFIVTSCSSSTESNAIKGAILESIFATDGIQAVENNTTTPLTFDNNVKVGDNSIEVYTAGKSGVKLTLVNEVNKVINSTELANLDVTKFTWVDVDNNDYDFKDGVFVSKKALSESNKTLEVELKANIEANEKKATTKDGEENGTPTEGNDGTDESKPTTPEKPGDSSDETTTPTDPENPTTPVVGSIKKTLTIKLTISFDAKPSNTTNK